MRPGETLGSEAYVTLCYELHHVVLPALEATDLVEFDRRRDELRCGERFGDWQAVLEETVDDVSHTW